MISKLVMVGATGDLAGRFLLPALATLHAAGLFPAGCRIVGAGSDDLDDDGFRRHVAERLDEHAPQVAFEARRSLVASLSDRRVDASDTSEVRALVEELGPEPVAVYLALPPSLFAPMVSAVGRAGLPAGSRIVVEKPFGQDLDDARALNALIAEVCGEAGETGVFRVDHVLGMATVQNLLALRFANPLLEAVWNSVHIDEIVILWEETLALEGRAGFYDRTGALKDVMQNHMMQLLSRIAMEEPTDGRLHDRKVELLRAVRPLSPDDVATRTRRARYTAGRLGAYGGGGGREVPSYVDEEGVDPSRGTETFAEVRLEVDNERWRGTGFVLRAGKAMAERRKGILVRFRSVGRDGQGWAGVTPETNTLWIGIDGPEDLRLQLNGSVPGSPLSLEPLSLTSAPVAADLPPYAHVLLDVLNGSHALSVRGDEAEQAWAVLTPVLQGWREGRVPLETYPAGSIGPGAWISAEGVAGTR